MLKKYYQMSVDLKENSNRDAIETILIMNDICFSIDDNMDLNKSVLYLYGENADDVKKAFMHITESGLVVGSDAKIDIIKEEEYLLKYLDNYMPITIGQFRIIPYFHELEKNESFIDITLNPGYSFGTGEHETTKLVLEHLSLINIAGKSVVDIGTGSGILSIAAEKKGACLVLGFDYDESTVDAAHDNSGLNETKNTFFVNSLDCAFKDNSFFDIVLINMMSKEFNPIFNRIIDTFLKKDGIMVLSGFLIEEENETISLIKKYGLKILKRICIEEWASYMLSY